MSWVVGKVVGGCGRSWTSQGIVGAWLEASKTARRESSNGWRRRLCFSQSVAAFDGDNTSRHSKRRQQWSPIEGATKSGIQWTGPVGLGIWFWVCMALRL